MEPFMLSLNSQLIYPFTDPDSWSSSGKVLLKTLLSHGIPCIYGHLTALGSLIARANLVLLGTASLLANGALYARAGTASCPMMAHERRIPVVVCCETYKFSDRVQLDSFVVNEGGEWFPFSPPSPRFSLFPLNSFTDQLFSSLRTGIQPIR